MGVNKQQKIENTDKRAQLRTERMLQRAALRQRFDINTIGWESLRYALDRVTAQGGALRIGLTRDGGALAVGVYGLGEPYTDYVRPTEDPNEYFLQLGELFESLGEL